MSMTNTVPIVRIFEQFAQIPSELTEDMLSMCVGPHYYLCRYAEAAEKALGLVGSYAGTPLTAAWPNRPAGGQVDPNWVSVFVDNALLQYFQDSLDDSSIVQEGSVPNQLVAADLVFRTANGEDRSAAFYDRDVQVGDAVRVRDFAGHTFWSQVRGFGYATVAASVALVGTGADANNQGALTVGASSTESGLSGVVVTASGATYAGLVDGHPSETYVLTCTKAMIGIDPTTAEFAISSASGTDDVTTWTPGASGVATAITARGAKITLTTTAGDTILVGDTITMVVQQTYAVPTVTVNPASAYIGGVNRRYVLTVVGIDGSAKPIVSVRTTTGDDTDGPKSMALATFVPVGNYGVGFKFSTVPCPGDKFYVDATAATAGKCNTLILARGLPSTITSETTSSIAGHGVVAHNSPVDLELTLYIKKNIQLPHYTPYPVENFTAEDLTLSLAGSIELTDSSWTDGGTLLPLPLVGGTVYVQYRALMPTFTTGRSQITTPSESLSILGPAVPENPLGMAVYYSALNSSAQPVGFIATPTDDLAGYAVVADLIKDLTQCYGLVVCSQEKAVQDLYHAHIQAQSAAQRHRFRIGYFNSASSSLVKVSDTDTTGVAGALTAKFTLNTDTGTNINLISENGLFHTQNVRSGDQIRCNFAYDLNGTLTYTTYVVDSVVSEDHILLMAGPAHATSTEDKIEIWRSQLPTEEATTYAALSAAFDDRRIRHIWPPVVELSDGTSAPGWVLCAAIAGLRSCSAPHQPLNTAELIGFASVLRSTRDMREDDLDIMCRGGTWVVTQDPTGGPVYNRLCVTTDTSDANHWQDSRTTNADSLAFGYYNNFKGIVGGKNITTRTLAFIANEFKSMSNYFMSEARTPELGAQLISATITAGPAQDPVLQDTVNFSCELETPYELIALNMYMTIK